MKLASTQAILSFVTAMAATPSLGAAASSLRKLVPDPGDSCSDATLIPVDTTVFGSTSAATADAGVGDCGGTSYGGAPGVWYTVTGTGEFFEANTCGDGTDYDTQLHVYSGSCDCLICVTGNDDSSCGLRSTVVWYANPGVVYYIFVHGFGSFSNGSFELLLQDLAPPDNDNACNALEITVNDPEAYANAYATVQAGEVTPGGGTGISCDAQNGWCWFDTNVQNSIWFSFIPEQDGCVDIFTDNTDDLQLAVWQVDDCTDFNTYTEVAANDDSGPDFAPRIIYAKVEAALPYLIQLDGYRGTLSSGYLIVGQSDDTTPPQVLCEPGVNPGGEKPDPDSNSRFYKLVGFDDCSEPALYVRDTVSGTKFGPFKSGAYIKYVVAKGRRPSSRKMNGAVDFMINGKGPAKVVAVDLAGNRATTLCA